MSITNEFFPESEQTTDGVAPFLRGTDFDGDGQKDLIVVGLEAFTPDDAKYGANNTYGAGGIIVKENYLVKEKVIKEGQSLKYKFTQDGKDRHFNNHSVGFFFAIKNANLEPGDVVNISRVKKSATDVAWTITKIK